MVITPLNEYIAAHGRTILVADNQGTATARYQLNIKDQYDNILITQFVTSFGKIGKFILRGTLGSLLDSYTNPIVDLSPGATSDINPIDHSKILDFEVIALNSQSSSIGDPSTLSDIKIHKAVDNKYGDKWGNSDEAFLALDTVDDIAHRHVFKNQIIPISFYTIDTYRNATLNGSTIATMSNSNGFGVTSYKENSNQDYNTLEIQGSDEQLIYTLDSKSYPRAKTLYFLNNYGGWEWYNFIDYEEEERATKEIYTVYADDEDTLDIFQQTESNFTQYKLTGVPLIDTHMGYIKYLITSPIVLDENGLRVKVIDRNVLTNSEGLLEPNITIQYIDKNNITL